jgi:putative two-component system response regulator
MSDVAKRIIMIVDDSIANLRIAKSALSDKYDVFTVPSAGKMFDLLERNRPGMILLDIEMPEMNGYQAIKILKARPETREIPVLFLTGKTDSDSELEGLNLGAIDYIIKPFHPALLAKRVEVHLTVEKQRFELAAQAEKLEAQRQELQRFNTSLREMVAEKTERVVQLQGAILKTVADLVESRDDFTGNHIERTQRGLGIMLTALQDLKIYREQMEDWDVKLLLQSSQLHDVGKIAISDKILLKPGRLTPAEYEEMKTHTLLGVQIIRKIEDTATSGDFLRHAEIFAGTHHEKWDGTGYPNGLKGRDIPLQGRLMAITDVYDALTSNRPYKRAFSHEESARIIKDGRGAHFDPVLVDVFEGVADRFQQMTDQFRPAEQFETLADYQW